MLCRKILRDSIARGIRHVPRCPLFTDESLGLTSFDTFRQQRRQSSVIPKDQLYRRLEQIVDASPESQDKKRFVFSEDLLQAIAVADTKDEVDRLYHAVQPFVKERVHGSRLRVLKPTTKPMACLFLKLCHRSRHPELAYRVMTSTDDKALEQFFGSDLQSYQISMDLLFETRQYQRVLDVWHVYETRRRNGGDHYGAMPALPRSLQVLVLASCYKLNTPESLQYAMRFIESGYDSSPSEESDPQRQQQPVSFTRKALALASALAANHNETELAFEFLSLIGHEVVDAYVAPRTLKCVLLAKLGRWPEVLGMIRRVLESDVPSQAYQDREISIDAVRAIEAGMKSISDKETVEKLKRCCLLLRRGGHVVDASLDDLLCAPVQIIPAPLTGRSTALLPDQSIRALGAGAAIMSPLQGSMEERRESKKDDANEKNIWETSSVYDDDSSALASFEKFQESERNLMKLERRKKKILNTVGKWIREEGPLEIDDDRGPR